MIRGSLVVLRAPEPADAETLNRWANDPDLWRYLAGWHFPYSLSSTRAWIDSRSAAADDDQVFCIVSLTEGLVGTANLTDLDWKNRTATHGIMLGEERFRGKGYAVDAEFALMRFAFEELGLERLDAEILGSNDRSRRFFEKCGWSVEGVRSRWYQKDGRRQDKLLVGILREEYVALAAKEGATLPRPSAHRRERSPMVSTGRSGP